MVPRSDGTLTGPYGTASLVSNETDYAVKSRLSCFPFRLRFVRVDV